MKKYHDLISVIVPVYKVEKYLSECIDSLLRQNYQNLEIILVDDGSPDNCPEICDNYQKKDPRITVLHQHNQGLSAARNTGLRAAKGNYICFVDSDDIVADNYCLCLYEMLSNSLCDFSVCKSMKFKTTTSATNIDDSIQIKYLTNYQYLKAQLNKETEFGVWNKMYRRTSIQDMSFFEEHIHEDVIWSADLADKLKNGVILTDAVLYYYRQRSDSIVAIGEKECSSDFIFAGRYLLNIIDSKYPELTDAALEYTISYPWSFVDRIYLKGQFRKNYNMINALKTIIREYKPKLEECPKFTNLQKARMYKFADNPLLYALYIVGRIIRTYTYRILGINPYLDEHSI